MLIMATIETSEFESGLFLFEAKPISHSSELNKQNQKEELWGDLPEVTSAMQNALQHLEGKLDDNTSWNGEFKLSIRIPTRVSTS